MLPPAGPCTGAPRAGTGGQHSSARDQGDAHKGKTREHSCLQGHLSAANSSSPPFWESVTFLISTPGLQPTVHLSFSKSLGQLGDHAPYPLLALCRVLVSENRPLGVSGGGRRQLELGE
ncbi:hypothetical protein D623_10030712 [Myotis brandtii]|uniref:Uncharacterized protein n=1 Tax=Myotis brandtii TaxID=109478 RepID=S7MT72_MYOBR|nr:hypothetical protein D623_10030712 [Myotis brandtii]